MAQPRSRPQRSLSLDPEVMDAAQMLSADLDIPLARIVDLALREELGRHGRSVEPATGIAQAYDGLIRGRRLP